MAQLTRRSFIVAAAAAGTLRALPGAVSGTRARHVVTLVYDKALGAMRLVDRVVP